MECGKPVIKPDVRTAATLVFVSERLEHQYCTVAGCNKIYVNNSFFPLEYTVKFTHVIE
jgi:hypothetical protein